MIIILVYSLEDGDLHVFYIIRRILRWIVNILLANFRLAVAAQLVKKSRENMYLLYCIEVAKHPPRATGAMCLLAPAHGPETKYDFMRPRHSTSAVKKLLRPTLATLTSIYVYRISYS